MIEMKIQEGIIKALERVYIYIDINEANDIDIMDYIGDSLQFMTFVVALEDIFSIEFPPELLLVENFDDINNIHSIISGLVNIG